MAIVNNVTPLVKIGGEGIPNTYPVYMSQVRRENPDWSFLDENEEELLNGLGYFVVQTTEQPVGEVVTEGEPVFEDAVWKQTWVTRSFSAEELASQLTQRKTILLADIAQKLSDAIEIGFPFTFLNDQGQDEIGHVQLRAEDRTNVSGSGLKADRLAALGVTDPIMPFRTFENVTYMCTPAQMKLLSDQAYDAYLIFIGMAWQLKDATVKAATLAELPTIPTSIELPGGWEMMLSPEPPPAE